MGSERGTSDGLRWGSLSFLGRFREFSPHGAGVRSAQGADNEAVMERETGQRGQELETAAPLSRLVISY